jgi:hypothetical protein
MKLKIENGQWNWNENGHTYMKSKYTVKRTTTS